MSYAIADRFESAALRYVERRALDLIGPYGRSVEADLAGIVSTAIWEGMDSMPSWVADNDPEREAWAEVADLEEAYIAQFEAGKLWKVPPIEEEYVYEYASALTQLRIEACERFAP